MTFKESQNQPTKVKTKMDTNNPTPTQDTPLQSKVVTSQTTTVTATSTHPKFHEAMAVMAALLPVIEAGLTPFEKNGNTIAIVNTEEPLINNLAAALASL